MLEQCEASQSLHGLVRGLRKSTATEQRSLASSVAQHARPSWLQSLGLTSVLSASLKGSWTSKTLWAVFEWGSSGHHPFQPHEWLRWSNPELHPLQDESANAPKAGRKDKPCFSVAGVLLAELCTCAWRQVAPYQFLGWKKKGLAETTWLVPTLTWEESTQGSQKIHSAMAHSYSVLARRQGPTCWCYQQIAMATNKKPHRMHPCWRVNHACFAGLLP